MDEAQEQEIMALEAKDIRFSSNGTTLLDGISFSVSKGKAFLVVGEVGSGQSLLVKLCVRLLLPASGELFAFGHSLSSVSYKDLKTYRQKLGVASPEMPLINNLSLFDNVALPLRYHTLLKEGDINERVEELLQSFGVHEWKDKRPEDALDEIQTLFLICRAFVLSPELLLLDGMFANIAIEQEHALLKHLAQLKTQGAAIFCTGGGSVTFARSLSDRMAVLRDGKFYLTGTPDEIFNSSDPYVKELLQKLF